MTNQENIIEAYVVEKPGSPGTITDFVRYGTPLFLLFGNDINDQPSSASILSPQL